jgi:hypothetical protein
MRLVYVTPAFKRLLTGDWFCGDGRATLESSRKRQFVVRCVDQAFRLSTAFTFGPTHALCGRGALVRSGVVS